MPPGIASGAWGFSAQNVAGMLTPFQNNFTYQSSLVSLPPIIHKNGTIVSPLTQANLAYYRPKTAFGSTRFGSIDPKYPLDLCNEFIRTNGTVNPRTGRLIKKNGPTYNKISEKCNEYQNYQTEYPFQNVSRPQTTGRTKCHENQNYLLAGDSFTNCNKKNDKLFTVGSKGYTINSTAKYNPSNSGRIIAMGCKQITILKDDGKQARICAKDFYKFNK